MLTYLLYHYKYKKAHDVFQVGILNQLFCTYVGMFCLFVEMGLNLRQDCTLFATYLLSNCFTVNLHNFNKKYINMSKRNCTYLHIDWIEMYVIYYKYFGFLKKYVFDCKKIVSLYILYKEIAKEKNAWKWFYKNKYIFQMEFVYYWNPV